MTFPISLIAFEKMREKIFYLKSDNLIYCVIISLRENIDRQSCRVLLDLSDAAMIFSISNSFWENEEESHVFGKVIFKNETC